MDIKINSDISLEELLKIRNDKVVAIDTETTGLDFKIHKLCTIQLYSASCSIIIRYDNGTKYNNLINLLLDDSILKIFHNAVFDVSFLMNNLKIDDVKNLACTKISSKLIHGLGHNNSLKSLLKEYLGISIDKAMQLSNWENPKLSNEQLLYAMNDVLYLDELYNKLYNILMVSKLDVIAKKTFEYIPIYVKTQLMNIDNIFVY